MTLSAAAVRIRSLNRSVSRRFAAFALLAAMLCVSGPALAQYDKSNVMAGAWRQIDSNYHPCPGCLLAVLPLKPAPQQDTVALVMTGNMCMHALPQNFVYADGSGRLGVVNEVSFVAPHPWADRGSMVMTVQLADYNRLEIALHPKNDGSSPAAETLTHIFERTDIDPNTISLDTIESDIRFRCTTPPSVEQIRDWTAPGIALPEGQVQTRSTLISIGSIVAYNCDGNYQIAVRRDSNDAISLISTNGGQINLAYTGPGEIYQAGTVAVSLVPDRMFLKFGDDRRTCFPKG